jgi:GNAT superfamily N-acetyltransferase
MIFVSLLFNPKAIINVNILAIKLIKKLRNDMLEIKVIDKIEALSSLKKQFLVHTTAPLDGMWLCGFLPMANHFGFYYDEVLCGYCCINDDGFLLQFYILPEFKQTQSDVFSRVVLGGFDIVGKLPGAFVSTAEPEYLSLCLDHFRQFKVNALMYHTENDLAQGKDLSMLPAEPDQLMTFVEFAKSNIGAPEQWVTGYYDNLISRTELFGYWQDDCLIAVGECRVFDEVQLGYADLGMIVAGSERGKGIATQVLNFLINHAQQKGLKPICSTEKTNIAAQKAITNAGLYSSNRIIQFEV